MEGHLDFLHILETDMGVNILACLDDASDLISASSVSRFWRDFVIANGLCKQLCLRNFPQLSNVVRVTEPSHGTKKPSDVGSSSSLQWEALDREHRVYGSLFKYLTEAKAINCVAEAFGASSTDNYPEECINNTLDPRDKILRRFSYWSSKGEINPDVPEALIYKLKVEFCAITEIYIRPFQAYFQPDHPIYSAKYVRFHMGHPKSPTEINKLVLPLQHHDDEKFIWTYTSPEFSMSQENILQNFKLPEPVLCVGGFVKLELLGRVQTQQMDEKYYICVSHVQILGRPVFPAFDVDIIEPSGKFLLKYDPEALSRTLKSISGPEASNVTAPTEERVWEHLEDLVGFLMQRNDPDGELVQLGELGELVEPVEPDDDEDDDEWDHVLTM